MKKVTVTMTFIAAVLLINLISLGEVKAVESTWITDKQSRCQVWNRNPQPNETISYRGECKNGKAHGYGTVIWYKDGKQNGKPATGNYVDGVFVGDKNFDGHILGLPNNDFLISLGTDTETGTTYWTYSRNNPTSQCWSWSGGSRDVYGVLPSDKSSEMLLNDQVARSITLKGYKLLKKTCKYADHLKVIILPNTYKIEARDSYTFFSPELIRAGLTSRSNDLSKGYTNYVLQAYQEKTKAQRKRREEEMKRSKAQKRLNDFVKKNRVKEWPSINELSANPFVYEGKTVAIKLTFSKMLTARKGIFEEDIVVSKIPKGTFTKRARVILAGRVLGNTAVKTPLGGEVLLPHLKFVGIHFCKDWRCSDLIVK